MFAVVALIAVANHFNFNGVAVSDAMRVEAVAELNSDVESVARAKAPKIADTFAGNKAAVKSSKTAAGGMLSVNASRVSTPSVDAGKGVKIYKNMLYAHSTMAGNAFKGLKVGQVFRATVDGVTAQYKVVSRQVYARDYLNNNDTLRLKIYNYKSGLSLMTCGNGSNNDENYRLVMFAERV